MEFQHKPSWLSGSKCTIKRNKSQRDFPPWSFFAFYFVKGCLNLKVQTSFFCTNLNGALFRVKPASKHALCAPCLNARSQTHTSTRTAHHYTRTECHQCTNASIYAPPPGTASLGRQLFGDTRCCSVLCVMQYSVQCFVSCEILFSALPVQDACQTKHALVLTLIWNHWWDVLFSVRAAACCHAASCHTLTSILLGDAPFSTSRAVCFQPTPIYLSHTHMHSYPCTHEQCTHLCRVSRTTVQQEQVPENLNRFLIR